MSIVLSNPSANSNVSWDPQSNIHTNALVLSSNFFIGTNGTIPLPLPGLITVQGSSIITVILGNLPESNIAVGTEVTINNTSTYPCLVKGSTAVNLFQLSPNSTCTLVLNNQALGGGGWSMVNLSPGPPGGTFGFPLSLASPIGGAAVTGFTLNGKPSGTYYLLCGTTLGYQIPTPFVGTYIFDNSGATLTGSPFIKLPSADSSLLGMQFRLIMLTPTAGNQTLIQTALGSTILSMGSNNTGQCPAADFVCVYNRTGGGGQSNVFTWIVMGAIGGTGGQSYWQTTSN
jgi:hypothetical protein